MPKKTKNKSNNTWDVVVVGGTPGGIAAAIAAARLGRSVAVAEYHPIIGGMLTNGLGKSDVETREAIGGLFREFTERVKKYYVDTYGADHENVTLCRDGYYYEPSVAQKILKRMVAEQSNIRLFLRHRLEGVVRSGNRITAAQFVDRKKGKRVELRGQVFIDATYEGDLAASAGAECRVGREGRAAFGELHAGVVYMDYETGEFLAGSTGQGDDALQAYTYRLCLTDRPENSHVLKEPPPDYDRTRYLGYIDDWKAGRMAPPRTVPEGRGYYGPTFNTVVRALSFAELPNGKYDVNMNPRPLGFPFAEENEGYVEADWREREDIQEDLRHLTLGLLYFLQNDSEVPEEHRELAQKFHLPRDEFADNGHFPWQLYIREARRLIGEYTLAEQDVTVGPGLGRAPVQLDSIAAGEFPIDSFPVRKREPGHDTALEGYISMRDRFTKPYQIPYNIMVPAEIDGLLVPVAASASHVAFSTIRLEPTWMAMGQAAGVAAHLAIEKDMQVVEIELPTLQRELLRQGQVLTYFEDIDRSHPAWEAMQYFGAWGFFPYYHAQADEPMDFETFRHWVMLVLGGAGEQLARIPSLRDDYMTCADLKELSEGAGLEPPKLGLAPDETVSRGVFCRWLYEALSE